MRNYIKPTIEIFNVKSNSLMNASVLGGCHCGCSTRDNPSTNAGCHGCGKCNHDNSSTHICPPGGSKGSNLSYSSWEDEL